MPDTTTILDFLKNRNSAPRLTGPGPDDQQVQEMIRCALRSPDHCWLRPWRFLSVCGEERAALGKLMLESLLRRQPDADTGLHEKTLCAPLRAPRLLVVFAALRDGTKVPHWEQTLSAGCAAFSILLAAEAMGFAAIWRTGGAADDSEFARQLGAPENEKIIGFIYLGTRDGAVKGLPALDPDMFHSHWSGLEGSA